MTDNDFELGNTRGTGIHVRVDPRERIPPHDKRAGEHFWIVITSYRVNAAGWSDEPGDVIEAHLDQENLVNIAGPLCFHCERPYTALLARRRCPGDPR